MSVKRVEEQVANVMEVMAQLSKMPLNAPVYFDCPHCGKGGGFHRLSVAVMVTTTPEPKP